MAGTLTISTLSDGTNSTSSTNCIQGSAKAWASYNGSTSTLNASYNVSSVTKLSTGNYQFNFTNAISDTKYGIAITNGEAASLPQNRLASVGNITTGYFQVTCYATSNSNFDVSFVGVSVFR